jgi:hypothetical protein
MEVSGQLHAPATLPPRKRAPGTHCIRGWVGPRAVLDAVVKRNNFQPPPGMDLRTPIIQPVAQRYAELSRLLYIRTVNSTLHKVTL